MAFSMAYDRSGHIQYIHTSTCFDFEHAETTEMAVDLATLTEPWQWQLRMVLRFKSNLSVDSLNESTVCRDTLFALNYVLNQ